MQNYDVVYPLTTLEGEIVGSIGWHRSNVKQGIHVDMSGSQLETLREMGFDTQELIKQIIHLQNAKITRLDLAIDIETKQKPHKLYKLVKNETIRSEYKGLHGAMLQRVTGYIETDKGTGGSTIYFGSTSSDQRARIYDKGAQRLQNEQLLRVEFVSRSERSQAWGLIVASCGIQSAAVSFYHSFLTGWAEMEEWISHLPDRLTTTIPRIDRPGSERWLRTVAVPAVIKAARGKGHYASDLRNVLREALFLLPSGASIERVPIKPLNGAAWQTVGVLPVKQEHTETFRFSQDTIDKFFVRDINGFRLKQMPL